MWFIIFNMYVHNEIHWECELKYVIMIYLYGRFFINKIQIIVKEKYKQSTILNQWVIWSVSIQGNHNEQLTMLLHVYTNVHI